MIQGSGRAVVLTEDTRAFRHWMVANPEVARTILEFKESNHEQHPAE